MFIFHSSLSPTSNFSDSSPSDSDSISSTHFMSLSNAAAILSSASLHFTISKTGVLIRLTIWTWNK